MKVVHCKRERFDRYTGRPGPFGNRFVVGRDGERGECVALHRNETLRDVDFCKWVSREFRGQVLGCWCAPKPCHGDILLWVANAWEDNNLSPSTQYFLKSIKCVVNRSNLVTTLAAGTMMQVDRVPVDLLPTVVLLATIGLNSYGQQLVDDYPELLSRMEHSFKDVSLTHRDYDHTELSLVSSIVNGGPKAEYKLHLNYEAEYMFAAYEELVINSSVEALFPPKGKV